jgi:hypothetical protein
VSNNAPRVAETPEGKAHAQEAEVLRELLELPENGRSEREGVFPTRDFRGHVSLGFAQAWDLLGYPGGYGEYQRITQESEEGPG